MPSHPPRSEPTKKFDILTRRETALRRAIAERQSKEKLQRAAEAVRVAKLNVFKGKLAAIRHRKGLDPETQPGAKIERDIKEWSDITLDDVVAMYLEVKLHDDSVAP